jgi:hypothetical protein
MSEQQAESSYEFSFKELLSKLGENWRYLKSKWLKLALIGLISGVVGFVYAWMQPIIYTAKTIFVVEEAKSTPSLGGLASLAGQFGVDMGSGAGGGLIAGDNILLYFKSESLAREVLLSPWDNTNKQSFADIYVSTHGLLEKWEKNKKIGKISFPIDKPGQQYSRLQDSLLQEIVKNQILLKSLTIIKLEKKAGFIQLAIGMQNEVLAKKYCDRLVEVAVNRYISLKTERQKNTVEKLQLRADSIARLLSVKTSASAALQTTSSTMDINPLYKTNTTVATELTNRDKTMLSTVYAEVVKNLELAKFTLSQATPVIQVVDSSFFPLNMKKQSRLISGIITAFGIVSLTILYLLFSVWIKKQL